MKSLSAANVYSRVDPCGQPRRVAVNLGGSPSHLNSRSTWGSRPQIFTHLLTFHKSTGMLDTDKIKYTDPR